MADRLRSRNSIKCKSASYSDSTRLDRGDVYPHTWALRPVSTPHCIANSYPNAYNNGYLWFWPTLFLFLRVKIFPCRLSFIGLALIIRSVSPIHALDAGLNPKSVLMIIDNLRYVNYRSMLYWSTNQCHVCPKFYFTTCSWTQSHPGFMGLRPFK